MSAAAIRKLVAKYQRLMGLDTWDIEVRFEKDLQVDGVPVTATSDSRHRYQDSILTFDLARIHQTRERLPALVRHEMLHIFTQELSSLAEQWAANEPVRQQLVEETNERATTMLERMVIWDG